MPTYEYKCENCDYEFEAFQSIKDNPLTKCPKCGKDKLRKLISGGAGLIFKGSGFYETDYKSKRTQAKKSTGKVIDTTKDSTVKETVKPEKTKTASSKTTKK